MNSSRAFSTAHLVMAALGAFGVGLGGVFALLSMHTANPHPGAVPRPEFSLFMSSVESKLDNIKEAITEIKETLKEAK